jgi:hypothetical protein
MTDTLPPAVQSHMGFEELWTKAIDKYETITGQRLDREATGIPNEIQSIDSILSKIEIHNSSYQKLREKEQRIRQVLQPVVECVRFLGSALSDGLVSS